MWFASVDLSRSLSDLACRLYLLLLTFVFMNQEFFGRNLHLLRQLGLNSDRLRRIGRVNAIVEPRGPQVSARALLRIQHNRITMTFARGIDHLCLL